jgi:4-amino-4-deoxy-L-arabinose transferase-like glycosyltransferase
MSRERIAFAGIVAVALGLRLVHVLTIRDYPLFEILPLDSESYDAWARAIVSGEWMRGRPFYQAPLYAYFLAGLHAVSGGDLLLPRLGNALLGTGTVALGMLLARRAFGTGAALAAGALLALHGTFLFEEGKVMKTSLGVFLITGTLVLLTEGRRRESARWLLAAGVAAGLAALVRENFALFALAAVGWTAWRTRRAAPPLALAAGAALAILPATLHNLSYDGEVLPITSQAGQNFYTGIHPGNDSGGYLVPEWVRRSPRFEEADFAAEAERRAGRELTPGETSRYWLREGLAVAAADPLRFARLFVVKLGLLFHDHEIPDDEDLRYFRRWAPVLRLPLPGFGVFAVLGLIGMAVAIRRRAAPPELVLFVAVYSVSVALFFVFSRYRLPLVPPLAVFAGAALAEGVALLRAGRPRPVLLAALATVPLILLVYRPLGVGTVANSHLSVGIAREIQGRPADALAEYRAGLSLEPDHPKLLRRAAKLAWDEAVAAGVERPDDALVDLIARASAANPDDTSLIARHAAALAATGHLVEAAARFREVLAAGEEPPGIHVNLALVYEALGETRLALDHAHQALARAPDDLFVRSLAERLADEEDR